MYGGVFKILPNLTDLIWNPIKFSHQLSLFISSIFNNEVFPNLVPIATVLEFLKLRKLFLKFHEAL